MASFVGRNAEFTDLTSSVDRAVSGRGGNGNAAVENAFDIAFHWREAGTFSDAERGAKSALVVGARSLSAYEYGTAFDQFNYAISAVQKLTNNRLTAEALKLAGREDISALMAGKIPEREQD